MRTFISSLLLLLSSISLQSQVLLHEIYGGGGNAGATWNRDVVILKNYGSTSVDISGYTLNYAGATGTSAWTKLSVPASTPVLAAGGIFRFCVSNPGATGSAPTCDATATTIAMAADDGRLALTLSSATTIPAGANTCPAITGAVLDFVPYGNASSCSPETPDPSAIRSVIRPSALAVPSDWTTNLAPLPIDFIDLGIRNESGRNMLNFTTASEQSNSHFAIERSADGRTFTQIGEVKGAGTTTDVQRYTYTDEQPLKGTNYYRLKQVDYDGTFEYSKVVSVRNGRTGTLSVIPTIVYDQIDVQLDATTEQTSTWQIFDMSGREVLNGAIEAEQSTFSANLGNLTQGAYIVRVLMGTEVLTQRVQKL